MFTLLHCLNIVTLFAQLMFTLLQYRSQPKKCGLDLKQIDHYDDGADDDDIHDYNADDDDIDHIHDY